MKHLLFVFLFVIVLLPESNAQGEEEAKVYLSKAEYVVNFKKNKKDEVHAIIDVKRYFVSQTSLKFTISEAVFFDENSEVKKLRVNGKKAKPIISDYQSEGIFHSDLKLCYIEHTFHQSGEKAKITYQKKVNDIKYLDPMYFVDRYEVDEATIRIVKPEWLELNIVEWNFDQDEVAKFEQRKGTKTLFTYQMKDLNSFLEVDGLPSKSKVYAHLILNPVALNSKGKRIVLMEDTGDLYGWYAGLVNEIGNDVSPLQTLVSELTKNATDDLDKIKSIYYWVQDNIRYIAFEHGIMGFRPEACQSVLANKYGDCKGMANLTKEMLKLAGYDARLTWVGTNTLPYDYSLPSLLVDNHMICTVFLNDEKVFLDATVKNADIFHNSSHIQGKQVLIEDGQQYIISTIPVDSLSNKEEYSSTMKLQGDQIVGKSQMKLSGGKKIFMAHFLSSFASKNTADILNLYLSKADKNIVVDLESTDLDIVRDSAYTIDYNLTVDNKVIRVGDEIYFNPEMDFMFKDFKKFEDRDIPYDLGDKTFFESSMTISLPEGYTVDYLPTPVSSVGNGFTANLSYDHSENEINYHIKFSISTVTLQPSEFDNWNQMIDDLTLFYDDQIILKKIP